MARETESAAEERSSSAEERSESRGLDRRQHPHDFGASSRGQEGHPNGLPSGRPSGQSNGVPKGGHK